MKHPAAAKVASNATTISPSSGVLWKVSMAPRICWICGPLRGHGGGGQFPQAHVADSPARDTASPRSSATFRLHHCKGCRDNRHGAEVTDYGHSGAENFALIDAHGPQRLGVAEISLLRETAQLMSRGGTGFSLLVGSFEPHGHARLQLRGLARGDRRAGENCSDHGRRPHGPRARSRILREGAFP